LKHEITARKTLERTTANSENYWKHHHRNRTSLVDLYFLQQFIASIHQQLSLFLSIINNCVRLVVLYFWEEMTSFSSHKIKD